ncbi:hypothetical protein [Pseudonocardia sp. HH130630-07]|uniref:hypothetical protein n=1 Tax=Pseudonocardia sp. HH130630-07 TaxID=1690815 RepID=UPI000814FF67|nr:hypothetical protein [Pseudonocardia sp. HH130630-07]ANY10626.1 hypothetical protein AFB00_29920 [Pseudonocardia sp. HH130630-07]
MSTTDWATMRAERQRLAAETAERQAAASLTRERVEAARAEREAAAAAAQRAQDQLDRDARRDRWAARRAALAAAGPRVAGLVACAAPTAIAVHGQYKFGESVMGLPAPLPALVPLMLEGAAWLLAWRRHQAVRTGEPSGRLAAGMWTIALTAAGLNLSHYLPNWHVGAVFGVASLVGFALVELLAQHERTALADGFRRRRRLAGLARTLRFPVASWRAWSRRLELGPISADPIADADSAWRHAWTLTHDETLTIETVDALRREADDTAAERDQARTDAEALRDALIERDDALAAEQTRTDVSSAAAEQARVAAAQLRAELTRLRAEHDQVLADNADLHAAAAAAAEVVDEGPDDDGDEDEQPGIVLEPELIAAGRVVAQRLAEQDKRLSRAALIAGLRADDHGIGTDRANVLLALLREEESTETTDESEAA